MSDGNFSDLEAEYDLADSPDVPYEEELVEERNKFSINDHPGKLNRDNRTFERKNQVRSNAQRTADIVDVARILLRSNMTDAEIAKYLSERRPYSVSEKMVANDIAWLSRKWKDRYLGDYEIVRGRELAKIDELERAYWEYYDRSRTDKVTTSLETIKNEIDRKKPGFATPEVQKKGKRKVEQRDGSLEALEGVQWCIDRRAKILGLDSAKRVEIDWRIEAQKMGFDPSELYNTLVKGFVSANAFTESEDGEFNKESDAGYTVLSSLGEGDDEGSLDGFTED